VQLAELFVVSDSLAQPKVDELQVPLAVHHYVLGLDVAMDVAVSNEEEEETTTTDDRDELDHGGQRYVCIFVYLWRCSIASVIWLT
jgi:hypothetical protein